MTLLEHISAAAAYLQKTVPDLTVNGVDLGLLAANQARRAAEQLNTFEFMRKPLTLTVNSVTGASLENAVIEGTATQVAIKAIEEIGIYDTNGNFRPVDWTTQGESLEQQRQVKPGFAPSMRYPTDECFERRERLSRLVLANDRISIFPKTSDNYDVDVVLDAYVFTPDWPATQTTATVSTGTGAGTYYHTGTLNGYRLFLNTQGAAAATHALWFKPTVGWVVTTIADLGAAALTNYHVLDTINVSPAGSYESKGGFAGDPTVTLTEANATTDLWLTHGSQYILWQTVVQLNYLFKEFVQREEGNLAAPREFAELGLEALRQWDMSKYNMWARR